MRRLRSRPLTLAVAAFAASVVLPAATATADPDTDADFLKVLSAAGIGDGKIAGPDPVALGQSVCPLLVEPGKTFASAVTEVRNYGVSPEMAAFFTGVAMQMYCPQMVASVADGSVLRQLRVLREANGAGF